MRDLSIDAVRGLCIASMVVAHVSMGSILFSLSHVQLWTDAAFGFVFLSGLVLGIVHRKKKDRCGAPDYRSVFKRAWMLYLIQFAILVLALAVRSLGSRPEELPEPADFGGWGNALGLIASLQIPAPNLTILPMYVVLLLAALGALALLAHGMTPVALVLSGIVYVLSLAFPGQTVMPYLAGDPAPQFNWAAWQLPFVAALSLGWHWRSRNVRQFALSKAVVAGAAIIAGVIFMLAQVYERTNLMAGSPVIDVAFAKFHLGPGAVVYGVAALIPLYWVAVRVADLPQARPVLNVLVTVGQRSLDSFVILCLAVILLPAVFGHTQDSAAGMVAAIAVLAACWGWAMLKKTQPTRAKKTVSA